MMLNCPILQPRIHELYFFNLKKYEKKCNIYVVKNYINAPNYSFIYGFNIFYLFNQSCVFAYALKV